MTGLVLAAALAGPVTEARAQAPTVAVARVTGPGTAGPGAFARGLRAGLAEAGVTVVKIGEVSPDQDGFTAEAQKAGAQFLVVVQLRYARKKRFVSAAMYDVASGDKVEATKSSFRSKRAATSTGQRIGKALGKAAVSRGVPSRPTEPVVAAAPPPPPAPAPKPAPPPTASTSKPDEGPGLDLGGKENAVFRLTVGAGTQLGSAYTVAVDGQVTGLAHTLNPLFLMTVGALVRAPSIGIGGEVWLSFVPVKYQIDVNPAVTPSDPGGRFFNVGGAVTYRLSLMEFGDTGTLYLTPLLGAGYGSMTAEGQGDNSVVVSYSAIDVQGGLRIGAALTQDLVVELETKVGGVLLYDEGPTTTGDSGSGINLQFGLGGRYWLNDVFGIYAGFAYAYQRVGLTGVGTRVAFQDDPQLLDATVFNGDFKLFSGVHIAL